MATIGRFNLAVRTHSHHPVSSKGSKHSEDGIVKAKPKQLMGVRNKEKDLAKLFRVGAINTDSAVIQSLDGGEAPKVSYPKPAAGTQVLVGTNSFNIKEPQAENEEYINIKVTVSTTLTKFEWRFHAFEVPVEPFRVYMKRTLYGSYNSDDDEEAEDEDVEYTETVVKRAYCKVYDVVTVEEDEDGDELDRTQEELVVPLV